DLVRPCPRIDAHRRGTQRRQRDALLERDRPGSEQTAQFVAQRGAEQPAVARCHSGGVQHQALDVQVDVHLPAPASSSPRNSASFTGFSSFWNSCRAASRTSCIETGMEARAARNAALSAMLWMLAPVRLSRARRSKLMSCIGVRGGNTFSQIALRSAGPGNGKLTMKRSRRRNAVSSADFMLVARIASPR